VVVVHVTILDQLQLQGLLTQAAVEEQKVVKIELQVREAQV
jgi:hypothetical protein